MTGMEIALLILGIVVFVASFIVPETMAEVDDDTVKVSEEKVKEIVDRQVKDAKEHIQDVVDETVSYAIEKSERSLERISNEKITAVSEFSETVLSDINKNHQEVMFMYDMLNDKQKNLRETAKQVDQTNAIAKETKNELEQVATETKSKIEMVARQLEEEEKLSAETVKKEDSFEPLDLTKSGVKKVKRSTKTKATKVIEPASMPIIGATENVSNNNNDRILELHKQGKSNIAIAKELGLGVGEVNLVIDLFEVM